MAGTVDITEVRAKFTADLAQYRRDMQNAAQITRGLQERIQSVSDRMQAMGAAASAETRRMQSGLAAAARQASTLGRQSQDLITKENQLNRSMEEQGFKLRQLQGEYEETESRLTQMQDVYARIGAATQGLDLSTPLTEQRARISEQMEQIEVEINRVQNAIARSGSTKMVFLSPTDILTVDQARERLAALNRQAVTAADTYQRLGSAIRQIGTDNLQFASNAGMAQLQNEISRAQSSLSQLSGQVLGAENRYLTYGQQLDQVRTQQAQVSASTDSLSSAVSRMSAQLSGVGGVWGRVAAMVSSMGAALRTGVASGLQMAGRAVATFSGRLLAMAPGSSIISNIVSRIRGVHPAASSAGSSMERMVRQIRNLGIVSLGLRGLRALFGELGTVVNTYTAQNQAAAAALQRLRNALANALAPAINVAINALNAILPYIQAVSNAFATLFTNLFGAKWTTISGGISGVGSAAAGAAESTGAANEAAQEYQKTLAGFDQITKLEDQSSSGGGSGGGGGGGTGGTTTSTTGGGEGLLGQFSEAMERMAEMIRNGEWANLGTYLAEAWGNAVNTLYNALTSPATYAKIDAGVNAIGTTINAFFQKLTMIDPATGDSIAERTGKALGAAINLAMYTVNETLKAIDFGQIGVALGQGINGAVEEINWAQVGETVSNWFLALPRLLVGVVQTVDWSALASSISTAIKSSLKNTAQFVEGVDWAQMARELERAVAGVDWGGIAEGVFELIGAGFGGLASFLGQLISDGLNGVEDYFQEAIDAVGGNVPTGILLGVMKGFANLGDWIVENIFDPFIDGFKAAFGIHSPASAPELVSASENVGLGILNAVAGVFGNIGTWAKENILDPIADAIKKAPGAALEFAVGVKNDAQTWWGNVKTWWGRVTGNQKAGAFSSGGVKDESGSWWSNVKRWWSGKTGNAGNFQTGVSNESGSWWSNVKRWWSGRTGNAGNFQTGVRNDSSSWWSNVKKWWSGKSSGGVTTKVNVTKGWKGSVLSALKLSNLSTKLNIKLPKISINWNSVSVLGRTFKYPTGFKIKWNARGGILDGAQIFGAAGNTLLGGGEAGREAVLPLDRNTEWMDKIAEKVASRVSVVINQSSASQPMNVNVYVGNDKLVTKVVRGINDITHQTGQCPIYV